MQENLPKRLSNATLGMFFQGSNPLSGPVKQLLKGFLELVVISETQAKKLTIKCHNEKRVNNSRNPQHINQNQILFTV
jgi:hypothetical protein